MEEREAKEGVEQEMEFEKKSGRNMLVMSEKQNKDRKRVNCIAKPVSNGRQHVVLRIACVKP